MSRRRWFVVAAVLAVAVLVAVAVFVWRLHTSSAPQHRQPPGAVSADAILQSFNDAFLMQANGAGYYRLTTAGRLVSFFKQAELIEMTEDAYQRSRHPRYKAMIGVLYNGLVAHHGTDWLRDPSNDDLMWAAVMCLRAYAITGDLAYLRQARSTFDRTYARAWSPDLGGGLWNTTRRLSKNACVNAPAVIAACMLSRGLRDPSYLATAKRLYGWLRATLYDPRTGAVYDHVTPGPTGKPFGRGVLDRIVYTYDQGGFIGAAEQLYQATADRTYYTDALTALRFARDDLTIGGILKSELPARPSSWLSAGGFKGMFVRWASIFINNDHVRGYGSWFRKNVTAVLRHANTAGLVDQDWSVQTGTGTLLAFSCSSAVVLLQWWPPRPAAGGQAAAG